MKFVSTRGEAPALSFEGALLAALARDGGLYMPEAWPRLAPEAIASSPGLDYADAAFRVMRPFLAGDPCLDDLEVVLEEAYGSFHHPAVAPLRQIAPNRFILELFHGPTLAFKDLAMQVVARLMNRALLRKRAHATVIGATSGDTGAAAIEAFRGLEAHRHFHSASEGTHQRRAAPPDDDRDRGERSQHCCRRHLRRLPDDR